MLVRATAGMTRLGAATLAPLSIDGRHYGVLAVLSELGPRFAADPRRHPRCRPSIMVAFVDELEEKGYVRRGRNPSDRRACAITLNGAGTKVQREAAELLENCERHYLDPLTGAERRTLLELLGRLVARDLDDT
jgi:DNA-binding MarR family transcriptional regulator